MNKVILEIKGNFPAIIIMQFRNNIPVNIGRERS